MRGRLFRLAAAACLVAALWPLAADARSTWDRCRDPNPLSLDARIAACTMLIEDAAATAPQRSAALTQRALAYSLTNENVRAAADIHAAAVLDPNNVMAIGMRSMLHANAGRYEEALQDSDAVIRMRPDLVQAYRTRCLAHARLDAYDAALADCSKAQELQPGAESENDLAWLAYQYGDYAVARAHAERAIALKEHAGIFDTLAHVALAQGDVDAARGYFLRVVELGDDVRLRRLESGLRDNGFDPGPIDGRFDDAALEALDACLGSGCRPLDPDGPRRSR